MNKIAIRPVIRYFLFTLVIWVLLMVAGCEKFEDIAPKSSFKYDGREYDLSASIIVQRGEGNSSYQLGFIIYSGFEVSGPNREFINLSGTGHAIEFPMIFSSSSEKLTPGMYNFDPYSKNQFTFSNAYVAIDFTNEISSGTISLITAGKLKISENNNIYELTFDFTDENNKYIKGYYKGAIPLKQIYPHSLKY